MQVSQVQDVITWSADYHEDLGRQYRSLADTGHDSRIKMVLVYLASHEQQMAKGLKQYLESAPPGLMHTWSRSSPHLEHPHLLNELKSSVDHSSVEQVTGMAIKIHEHLGNMYDELVQAAEIDEQRELLEALRDHELSETRRMVRDISRFEIC